jgi:hypothetical protein
MKIHNSFVILGLSFLVMAPAEISTTSRKAILETQQSPCTQKSAENTPFKWKKEIFNSLPNNPALSPLVAKLDMQAEILHKALGDATGFDAKCYFWVPGNPFSDKNPHVMEVNVNFYPYYCDDGKLEVEKEYSDGIRILGNGSGGPGFKIGTKTFRLLGSPIGEIRGYPAFEADWTGTPGGGATFTWTVLVTKKGMPLFRYATRKELLDHLMQVVEKKRPEDIALIEQYTPIRPSDVQVAEKQKELTSFIASAKDDAQRKNWTDRFNRDYRTDQQKLEEAKIKCNANADKVVARLKSVRARYSPAGLEETAYVYKWLTNYNTAFYEEDFDFDLPKNDPFLRPTNIETKNMGKPFAISQKSYFDPNLPGTSPQYFTVDFSWTVGKSTNFRNEKFEKLRDDFFARFDFDKLAEMLGK